MLHTAITQSLVYQTEATVLSASAVNKSVQTNIPKSTESVISSARNQHSSQTAYWKTNPRKYGETFFVVQECIGSISASEIRKWISNSVHSWRDAYMPWNTWENAWHGCNSSIFDAEWRCRYWTQFWTQEFRAKGKRKDGNMTFYLLTDLSPWNKTLPLFNFVCFSAKQPSTVATLVHNSSLPRLRST